jgi:hypothetical protein
MMIDFLEQQEKLELFIKDNYQKYLDKYGIKSFEVTTDFLDFDRYKNDFTLFIDFSKVNFSSDDDCYDTEKLSVNFFLVVRNDTSKNIKTKLLDSSSALYTMIKENNSLGMFYKTIINEIQFYNYAEGSKYIMIADFDIALELEV